MMRHKVMLIQILAELYMLTDKSPSFQESERFVDRRMQDFESLSSLGNNVS